jgi:hypothetical protein
MANRKAKIKKGKKKEKKSKYDKKRRKRKHIEKKKKEARIVIKWYTPGSSYSFSSFG